MKLALAILATFAVCHFAERVIYGVAMAAVETVAAPQ